MEVGIAGEMSDIRHVARDEIVDRDDAMAFGKQTVGKMRPQKTCAPGDNRNGLLCASWHNGFIYRLSQRSEQEAIPNCICNFENRAVLGNQSILKFAALGIAQRFSAGEPIDLEGNVPSRTAGGFATNKSSSLPAGLAKTRIMFAQR